MNLEFVKAFMPWVLIKPVSSFKTMWAKNVMTLGFSFLLAYKLDKFWNKRTCSFFIYITAFLNSKDGGNFKIVNKKFKN